MRRALSGVMLLGVLLVAALAQGQEEVPAPTGKNGAPHGTQVAGLTGEWEHLNTKTRVVIVRKGQGYEAVSAVDDDGEVFTISSQWTGGQLQFTWRVPSTGWANSFRVTEVKPDEFVCDWSGNAGKGVRRFRRIR